MTAINRRTFTAALAGFAAGSTRAPVIVLDAVIAPRVPHRLAIDASLWEPVPGSLGTSPLFELRTYLTAAPGFRRTAAAIFTRAGIRTILYGQNSSQPAYLIPFDSFTAREKAWNAVNADPEWAQARRSIVSYQFSLYRIAG
jgi:hypothetical protein